MTHLCRRVKSLERDTVIAFIEGMTGEELIAYVGAAVFDDVALSEMAEDEIEALASRQTDRVMAEIIRTYGEKRR